MMVGLAAIDCFVFLLVRIIGYIGVFWLTVSILLFLWKGYEFKKDGCSGVGLRVSVAQGGKLQAKVQEPDEFPTCTFGPC